MLYREIIADCPQIHTKHINTLCRQCVVLRCALRFVISISFTIIKHQISCVCQTVCCQTTISMPLLRSSSVITFVTQVCHGYLCSSDDIARFPAPGVNNHKDIFCLISSFCTIFVQSSSEVVFKTFLYD